jgi:hypothetical protein
MSLGGRLPRAARNVGDAITSGKLAGAVRSNQIGES